MKPRSNLNLSSTFSSILGSFQALLTTSSNKLQTVHREAVRKVNEEEGIDEGEIKEELSSEREELNDKQRARLERQRRREARRKEENEKTSTWETSNWSECSESCGGGVRTRDVECSGTHCSDPKPITREICNTNLCAPSDEWSCQVGIKNGFVERRKSGRVLRFECADGYSMRHPADAIRPVRFRFCKCANGLRISDPSQCSKHILNDELLPYCEAN